MNNNDIITNIIRFVALLLFQVLVLNQVELHGFISPYVYPLFILLLPFNTPKSVLLITGFAMGLFVDIFANTPGLHASATVFLAYIRPALVSLNLPPGGYETSDKPRLYSLGLNWFLIYAGAGILAHHFFYFLIETYSFTHLFFTIFKTLCSGFFSLLLILLHEYIFYKRR